jgi:hypothetical protein
MAQQTGDSVVMVVEMDTMEANEEAGNEMGNATPEQGTEPLEGALENQITHVQKALAAIPEAKTYSWQCKIRRLRQHLRGWAKNTSDHYKKREERKFGHFGLAR